LCLARKNMSDESTYKLPFALSVYFLINNYNSESQKDLATPKYK
jgi:hypothetical protein